MQKEIQTKGKPANPIALATDVGAWQVPEMSSQDIAIPKLLFMQKMSEAVDQKKAVEGDFLDSLSGKVVGNISNKPFHFVPIHMQIVWYIFEYDKKTKKFEYKEQHPLVTNAANPNYNDKWKYEETVGGIELKRERRMLFYALNCDDVGGLPYVITFKVTSARAGKNLATQMYTKNISMGLVPPARAFKLGGKVESNDKGSFVVVDVEEYRMSNEKELERATHWYKTILKGSVTVDESDVVEGAGGKAQALNEDEAQY